MRHASSRRLAACLECLDGGLGHGPGGVGCRERPNVDALGRREQAATRHHLRVAGAARHRVEAHVRARPRAGRQEAAGRQQLHDSGGVVVGVGKPRAEDPIARGRAAHHRGHHRLRATVDELDDATVARHHGFDRLERAPDRRRLPAPRCAQ